MKEPLTVLKVDNEEWREVAQAGELAFHKRPNFRTNQEVFNRANESFFKGLGFKPEDMAGKVVVDLGAGSKLRGKFFKHAKLIAIEPLADQFIKDVPWCDLSDADKCFALPAEQLIDEIAGVVDLLFSINVLDHCYDFPVIAQNIFDYLKDGGTAMLSFDCHSRADKLHPIIINEKVATSIFFDIGFRIDKFMRTASYHRAISDYAVTYFMTKIKNRD